MSGQTAAHQGFGAFGKMPAVGDFFRLRAPRDFVETWDQWLQQGMLDGARSLGDAWDSYYMSTPLWRFSLSAGLAGAHSVMGVLMPSVDRVGRRFPLTLVAIRNDSTPVILSHLRTDTLFRLAEDVALAALDDSMTRDRLDEELNNLPLPAAAMGTDTGSGPRGAITFTAPADGAGPAADLAAAHLADRYRRPSVWSAEIDGTQHMMICEGLPEGSTMQALFNLNAPIWTEDTAG